MYCSYILPVSVFCNSSLNISVSLEEPDKVTVSQCSKYTYTNAFLQLNSDSTVTENVETPIRFLVSFFRNR